MAITWNDIVDAQQSLDAIKLFLNIATVSVILIGVVFGANEYFGFKPLEYSKFGHESSWKVPSKVGMFILYFPAAVVPVILRIAINQVLFEFFSFERYLFTAMLVIHFGKRCLEVLFLHKFSGSDGIISVFLITFSYSLVAAAEFLSLIVYETSAPVLFYLGVIVFLVGEAGNFYHHYLLANLRKPGETEYKAPVGGLFELICCPHYFFELVAWLGLLIALPCPATVASLAAFTLYLFGRSQQTLLWYRSKKLNIPTNWKRLIPYLY